MTQRQDETYQQAFEYLYAKAVSKDFNPKIYQCMRVLADHGYEPVTPDSGLRLKEHIRSEREDR